MRDSPDSKRRSQPRVLQPPVQPVPDQTYTEPLVLPQIPPTVQLPDFEDIELLPPELVSEPDNQQMKANARREAYKVMVTEVQKRLNEFGFNPGYTDGVPRSNTLKVLADFYSALRSPVITSITDKTIKDLDSEKLKLRHAERVQNETQSTLSADNKTLTDKKA